MSDNKLEKTTPKLEADMESDQLAEYLMGEEGGEWLWLSASLLAK
jgi:hypothetical protein